MPLSTYSAAELLRKWQQQELTSEQLSGHTVQHLVALWQGLAELEKRLRPLEQPRPEARKDQ